MQFLNSVQKWIKINQSEEKWWKSNNNKDVGGLWTAETRTQVSVAVNYGTVYDEEEKYFFV